MRTFVAIPIPKEMKQQLALFCDKQKEPFPFRKWVHMQDYHITLKYLGECTPDKLEKVKEQLERIVPSRTSFPLTVGGLGHFGRSESPRILWADVLGDLTSLQELQRDVDQAMSDIGFAKENRPYRPHITLAKNFKGDGEFQLELPPLPSSWSWEVRSAVLYRTELGHTPMYFREGEYLF